MRMPRVRALLVLFAALVAVLQVFAAPAANAAPCTAAAMAGAGFHQAHPAPGESEELPDKDPRVRFRSDRLRADEAPEPGTGQNPDPGEVIWTLAAADVPPPVLSPHRPTAASNTARAAALQVFLC
ncbi:hypothetical protein [Streptomyces physcomitrii]|uniref:Secreted protein n=1 Tax=Streptomyces physcomitrii TaxID=2724184 RepID=A0ABX1HAZ4_9ACTN|nr:hypothetical protein [Streptomyces physcomitrii]NKI44485.1 hypothetical protein [Streptomyces physcomitrii]